MKSCDSWHSTLIFSFCVHSIRQTTDCLNLSLNFLKSFFADIVRNKDELMYQEKKCLSLYLTPTQSTTSTQEVLDVFAGCLHLLMIALMESVLCLQTCKHKVLYTPPPPPFPSVTFSCGCVTKTTTPVKVHKLSCLFVYCKCKKPRRLIFFPALMILYKPYKYMWYSLLPADHWASDAGASSLLCTLCLWFA